MVCIVGVVCVVFCLFVIGSIVLWRSLRMLRYVSVCDVVFVVFAVAVYCCCR